MVSMNNIIYKIQSRMLKDKDIPLEYRINLYEIYIKYRKKSIQSKLKNIIIEEIKKILYNVDIYDANNKIDENLLMYYNEKLEKIRGGQRNEKDICYSK